MLLWTRYTNIYLSLCFQFLGVYTYNDNSMFNFLQKWRTLFHSSYIILHLHQQCTRVPAMHKSSNISTSSLTLVTFSFLFVCLLSKSHPNACEVEVVPHCGFDLHFSNDFMCYWPFVYLLWKISIQVLCLFFWFLEFPFDS